MTKRTLYALLAGIVALSLIVGGVFAWADNTQHKSNIATGGGSGDKNDIVLIEDYKEPDDWQEGDELKKEVWAKNTGEGQLYVRLQLKEYMDIAKVTYVYAGQTRNPQTGEVTGTPLSLLVNTDGKFMASANTGAPTAADLAAYKLALTNLGLVFEDDQIVGPLTAYGETVARYYLKTDGTTNLNGKYGKRLLMNFTQDEPRSLVEDVERGTYEPTDDHKNHPTSECAYTPHLWSGSTCENCGQGDDTDPYDNEGLGFHDYVQWILGDSKTAGDDLILLSAWDGEPTAKWILDDMSDAKGEGWAYWGEALQPGEGTAKLLEKIKLIKQPEGPFYYALHVDMQAADISQLTANFDGMPEEIEDSYRGKTGLAIKSDRQTVTQGGTMAFHASWNGTVIPASDVTWGVTHVGAGASGTGTNTKFNQTTGVLTIGGLQPIGTLLVTAKYTPPGGTERTARFIITVKAKAP